MSDFENYFINLAKHEEEKSKLILDSPRQVILVNSGVMLNWLGDYFANPEIKWKMDTLNIHDIEFTGTSLEWNQILINQCKCSPQIFLELIEKNPDLKTKFINETNFNRNLPIVVRKSENKSKYKVLDGMHRFVGAVVNSEENVNVYLPEDESILPWCEPHVIYDLIRGFMKNARDEEGEKELYHSLKLLLRTYGNTEFLLKNRFNIDHINDKKVQEIIQKALN